MWGFILYMTHRYESVFYCFKTKDTALAPFNWSVRLSTFCFKMQQGNSGGVKSPGIHYTRRK